MTKTLEKGPSKSVFGPRYTTPDSRTFKGKLIIRWLGLYLIEKCHENGSIQIKTFDEEGIPLLVNGYWLKLYTFVKTGVYQLNRQGAECNWGSYNS